MAHTATLKTTPTDNYPTATSAEQAATEEALKAFLPSPDAPQPFLNRNAHLQYAVRCLSQGFPPRFVSQDASQPWLVFWTIQSLAILGVGLDPDTKQRVIDTVMACQHPDGGFGGGPKQAPHLLPTYAAVSVLAIVGRPGPKGGWDQIDRDKLYKFFVSLKQPDGSFLVAHDSEVDVRGTYCLLCVAIFLNLITPELIAGVPSFLASLQTYEGGFSNASQPFYLPGVPESPQTLLPSPRPPLGEAHGGYTYCAVASWAMLKPLIPLLKPRVDKDAEAQIDIKRLVRWLVNQQGSPVELGGFRGRTNKLVDACYSWWVGGVFNLLGALGIQDHLDEKARPHVDDGADATEDKAQREGEDSWTDADEALFDRLGLQQYILCAAQDDTGGMRDKPGKRHDSYHTMYALSGLGASQHRISQPSEKLAKFKESWKSSAEDSLDELHKSVYCEARAWTEDEASSRYLYNRSDRVNAPHPLLVLMVSHVKGIMDHFYHQG